MDTAPLIYFIEEHPTYLPILDSQQYRDILLNAEGLTTVEVSVAIAEGAAQLRSQYSLRTPDAIQIATALQSGATALITNDIRQFCQIYKC